MSTQRLIETMNADAIHVWTSGKRGHIIVRIQESWEESRAASTVLNVEQAQRLVSALTDAIGASGGAS